MIRAAAVWHGDLGGKTVRLPPDPAAPGLELTATEVDVPTYYARAGEIPACYAFKPTVSAECAPDLPGDGRISSAITTAGVYSPFYYALVGWPSRVFASDIGVYLMRATSALLCALLVTFAVGSLGQILDRSLALASVWVAATPMVHYLAGSVNPNGLETAAAIAVWASALVVLRTARDGRMHRPSLALLVAASVALVSTRTLSPAFFAVIAVAAAFFSGWGAVRSVLRQKWAWAAAGLVGVVGLANLAWAARADQLGAVVGGYVPDDENLVIWLSGGIDDWMRQMVAVFGWLDVGPVEISVALWLGVVAVVVTLGLVWAKAWRAVWLFVLTLGALVLPVLIQAPVAREHGIAWQGRYLLPVAVGIPIVAFLAADDGSLVSRLPLRRFLGILFTACGVALVVAHVVAMQRYVTGTGEVQNYLVADGWNPPLGTAALLALALLGASWPLALVLGRSPAGADGQVPVTVVAEDGPQPGEPPAAEDRTASSSS